LKSPTLNLFVVATQTGSWFMLKRSTTSKPYYGWYITITLALTETISWGIIYYAFSVFLSPMELDLGWSRAELTGGFSLALLVTGAAAFPVGMWIDRHGARLLMTIGSIGAALLVIAWSQVSSLPAFYMIWAGLGVCAATVLYEPAFAVIAQWFHQRRSTALAIVTFAAGLASTIFLPLSDALLRNFGWRTAILILGLFLAIMTIPLHALILRSRPEDYGLLPDGTVKESLETSPIRHGVSLHTALQGRAFWLLTLGFGLASLSAAAALILLRLHLPQGQSGLCR
jgi:sugar phosphate permease